MTLFVLVIVTTQLPVVADDGIEILRDHYVYGQVYEVAFSPDGKLFASAEKKETLEPYAVHHFVTLWDAAAKKERASLKHDGLVQSVAFSPDGRLLATGAGDFRKKTDAVPGIVALWDTNTGKSVDFLTSHSGAIICVRFSDDGRLVAAADILGTIRIWDAKDRKHVGSFAGDGERIRLGFDMAFSPDGKTLAAAGGKFLGVRLWDVSTGEVRLTIPSTLPVTSVTYSADGKNLAYNMHAKGAGEGVFVRLMDAEGKMEKQLLGDVFASRASCVRFSRDSKKLVVGRGAFSDVVLWDLETLKVWVWTQAPNPGRGAITSVAFSPDGTQVLAGRAAGRGGQLLLWDVRTAKDPNEGVDRE